MPVPKEAIGHTLEAYRRQLDVIASTEVGRPKSIPTILNGLADLALESIRQHGVTAVELAHPELDTIDDDAHDEEGHQRPESGRLIPANNLNFLSAHRANLAALEAELAKLP
jgi:hypothetical protein